MKVYTKIMPEGKVPHGDAERLRDEVMKHCGKEVCFTIERKRKKRTTPQLRYYHGYCLKVLLAHFRECGHQIDKGGLDAFLRLNVLLVRDEVLGQWVPGHTEDLEPAEMEERLGWLRKWAAEVYCDLEEPNEHLYKKIGDEIGE